jgi:hypothetical protein
MAVEVIGPIVDVAVIARGASVRRRAALRKRFGGRQWRKLKGIANVRLPDGKLRRAEVHWYEAHGIGKVGMKIKRVLGD